MSDPHVLTFEKDIENEIRSKSASLVDIASSSGVVQNRPENKVGSWAILVFIMIFILVAGIVAYFYVIAKQKNLESVTTQTNDKKITTSTFQSESPSKNTEVSPTIVPNTSTIKGAKIITEPLSSLFPNVFPYIENNLVKGEAYETGYIITFTGYTTVYKAVLDNETLFTKDLINLYGLDVSSTSPIFRDIKVGDIDARALIVPNGKKIYYSFVKPSKVVIADTDTLLQRIISSILK